MGFWFIVFGLMLKFQLMGYYSLKINTLKLIASTNYVLGKFAFCVVNISQIYQKNTIYAIL